MSHHGGVIGYLLSGVEFSSVYVLKDLELTEKMMKTLHFDSKTTIQSSLDAGINVIHKDSTYTSRTTSVLR